LRNVVDLVAPKHRDTQLGFVLPLNFSGGARRR
jgi:hypothetical protein